MSPTVCVISFRAAFFTILLFSTSVVFGMSGIDVAHIESRENSASLRSAAYDRSAVFSGDSLIRTSVNLVLVPVSITDDYHRPVVGLDQDNFQLFEGKTRQEIKNFSSEDAPV